MPVRYGIDGRTVRAEDGDRSVGRIVVPDIDFRWCDGVSVKMAGIAGVQTDEAYRQQGIAGRMMQEALSMASGWGHTCSGITTTVGNVARRLYSRAGYTTLFRPGRFVKSLGPAAAPRPSDVRIRPYEVGEESALIALFNEIYRPYFGRRRKTPMGWRKLREGVLADSRDLIQVAMEGDRMVGWAGCFDQWVGRVTELHVRRADNRSVVATDLIGRVEAALRATGTGEAQVWASQEDVFTCECLVRSGYRYQPMRVFYLAIIDLPGLLKELQPALALRIDGRKIWSGCLRVATPGHSVHLQISPSVEVRHRGPADVTLSLSNSALCRMLSGRSSAWELYLANELSTDCPVTPDFAELLRLLFPPIPAFHPADDLW